MLTCKQFDAFIVDYLEGRLPFSTRLSMRLHLALCWRCRAYLRKYRRTIELGQSVFGDPDQAVPDEVPDELVKAVLAHIDRPHIDRPNDRPRE